MCCVLASTFTKSLLCPIIHPFFCMQNIHLTRWVADLLGQLFPRLGKLVIDWCRLSPNFLQVFSCKVQLHSLDLGCALEDTSGAAKLALHVNKFTSLQSLNMNLVCTNPEELPLNNLTNLKQLRSLRICDGTPIGWELFLTHVPLTDLTLEFLHLPCDTTRIASKSLRSIYFTDFSLEHHKVVCKADLPNLTDCDFSGWRLTVCDEDQVQHMIKSLSELPLNVVECSSEGFSMSLDTGCQWEESQILSALRALVSCPVPGFQELEKVCIYFRPVSGVMKLLCKLFIGPVVQFICHSGFADNLVDVVQGMASLEVLCLYLEDEDPAPQSITAALLMCTESHRSFKLSIFTRNPSVQLRLDAILEQWIEIKKVNLGSPDVHLIVRHF